MILHVLVSQSLIWQSSPAVARMLWLECRESDRISLLWLSLSLPRLMNCFFCVYRSHWMIDLSLEQEYMLVGVSSNEVIQSVCPLY